MASDLFKDASSAVQDTVDNHPRCLLLIAILFIALYSFMRPSRHCICPGKKACGCCSSCSCATPRTPKESFSSSPINNPVLLPGVIPGRRFVVAYTSSRCVHCQALKKIWPRISHSTLTIPTILIDVDEYPALFASQNIDAYPTILKYDTSSHSIGEYMGPHKVQEIATWAAT